MLACLGHHSQSRISARKLESWTIWLEESKVLNYWDQQKKKAVAENAKLYQNCSFFQPVFYGSISFPRGEQTKYKQVGIFGKP